MTTGLEKARALGVPRTAEERVAAHYGISTEEAAGWLRIHPESELVPRRGTGLITGRAASLANEVPQFSACLPLMLVGGIMGGILGVGFALILQKGEH